MTQKHKLYEVRELSSHLHTLRHQGKSTSLITGCFDILHLYHVETFRFAKTQTDYLIIGLEDDASIRISKGSDRPVFSFDERASLLSALECVDFIVPVEGRARFGSPESNKAHEVVNRQLLPDVLILTPLTDRFWERKLKRAADIGATAVTYPGTQTASSSATIRRFD